MSATAWKRPDPWDLREALAKLTFSWSRRGGKIKTSRATDDVRYILYLDEQYAAATPTEGPRVQAAQLLRNEADRIASRHPHGMNSDEFTVCTWLRHRANEFEDFGRRVEDDVKGEGARFYPERLTCSKGDPVEYVHIAEHHPERDAGRMICGVHEYGRGDNLAVPCGPNGPFAHFSKGPGLRVVHHYVQGAGSIADCGRGFTGSGPDVGFTDDWSAVTCVGCHQSRTAHVGAAKSAVVHHLEMPFRFPGGHVTCGETFGADTDGATDWTQVTCVDCHRVRRAADDNRGSNPR